MTLRTRKLGSPLVAGALATLLTACSFSSVEAGRATSPDGSRDAVVLEGGVNATTSFTYIVCIVPIGEHCTDAHSVAQLYAATRNSHAFGVDLAWQSPAELEVQYLRAQNAQVLHASDPVTSDIKVTLHSGVENPEAPAGAMVKGG